MYLVMADLSKPLMQLVPKTHPSVVCLRASRPQMLCLSF